MARHAQMATTLYNLTGMQKQGPVSNTISSSKKSSLAKFPIYPLRWLNINRYPSIGFIMEF